MASDSASEGHCYSWLVEGKEGSSVKWVLIHPGDEPGNYHEWLTATRRRVHCWRSKRSIRGSVGLYVVCTDSICCVWGVGCTSRAARAIMVTRVMGHGALTPEINVIGSFRHFGRTIYFIYFYIFQGLKILKTAIVNEPILIPFPSSLSAVLSTVRFIPTLLSLCFLARHSPVISRPYVGCRPPTVHIYNRP